MAQVVLAGDWKMLAVLECSDSRVAQVGILRSKAATTDQDTADTPAWPIMLLGAIESYAHARGIQGTFSKKAKMATAEAITAKLKEFGTELKTKPDSSDDWSELGTKTKNLILNNPFAFLIAIAFDRGMPWQSAFQIPVEIERKGCLDPKRLAGMTDTELCKLLEGLKTKPRYGAIAGSKTLADAAHLVCEQFDGDAAAIWTSASPCEVEKTLQKIHGIGAGISSMTTRILHEKFGCFKGQESQIEIKPDIHLLRVFKRTGLIEKKI